MWRANKPCETSCGTVTVYCDGCFNINKAPLHFAEVGTIQAVPVQVDEKMRVAIKLIELVPHNPSCFWRKKTDVPRWDYGQVDLEDSHGPGYKVREDFPMELVAGKKVLQVGKAIGTWKHRDPVIPADRICLHYQADNLRLDERYQMPLPSKIGIFGELSPWDVLELRVRCWLLAVQMSGKVDEWTTLARKHEYPPILEQPKPHLYVANVIFVLYGFPARQPKEGGSKESVEEVVERSKQDGFIPMHQDMHQDIVGVLNNPKLKSKVKPGSLFFPVCGKRLINFKQSGGQWDYVVEAKVKKSKSDCVMLGGGVMHAGHTYVGDDIKAHPSIHFEFKSILHKADQAKLNMDTDPNGRDATKSYTRMEHGGRMEVINNFLTRPLGELLESMSQVSKNLSHVKEIGEALEEVDEVMRVLGKAGAKMQELHDLYTSKLEDLNKKRGKHRHSGASSGPAAGGKGGSGKRRRTGDSSGPAGGGKGGSGKPAGKGGSGTGDSSGPAGGGKGGSGKPGKGGSGKGGKGGKGSSGSSKKASVSS